MSRYSVLPAGLSEKDFAVAIRAYRELLGEENVLIDPKTLTAISKIMIAESESLHMPSAVIRPQNVKEVQGAVLVANKYKTPLWMVSTGKNFGYGSAAPVTRGQIVMDLKRMNRIVEVDAELAYAVVEPGVTYYDLNMYLEKNKIALIADMPAPSAIVGPLGNSIDRGLGYMPYGDHFLFSCGAEVVMPNGELIRTGMGSMPNSKNWQVYKWGYGPYIDGIFSQGNYGILTKLGIWLMPGLPPGTYKHFLFTFPREDMAAEILCTLVPLKMSGVLAGGQMVGHALYDMGAYCGYDPQGRLINRSTFYEGKGKLPWSAVEEMMKRFDLGAWNLWGTLYGPPDIIELNWEIVTRTFRDRFGDAMKIFTDENRKGDIGYDYRTKLMRGVMTLQEFGLYNWRGGGGGMWLFTSAAARPDQLTKQIQIVKQILDKYRLDYTAEFGLGWRDLHHGMDLLFDRTDPEETQRAYDCYEELVRVLAANTFGVYRTNTAFMKQVAATYGPEQNAVWYKLKKGLDPNNIIAPGKSGISLAS